MIKLKVSMVMLTLATAAATPAFAAPPASQPSGHPVPEITVNMEDGNKQISVQIGCEGANSITQTATPGSNTFQRSIQIGNGNVAAQTSTGGYGNTQVNRQKVTPKGGWDCP